MKHRIEYALVIFWMGIFHYLPYRMALGIGWITAWFGHFILHYRRDLVHARIRQVFPDISEKRVKQIAWRSWRNLIFNMIDVFRLSRMDRSWLQRHVVDYDAVVERAVQDGLRERGFVAVSLHMGCAEISARLLQDQGGNVVVISKPQKNLLVSDRLMAMRGATGITILPVGDGIYKQVLRKLRAGAVLAMLADLRVDEGGGIVDFLGHKASVAMGAAMFARRANLPLICAITSRVGWCKHRVDARMTLHPDESLSVKDDVQRMMQAVFVEFEKAIQDDPEQWFWHNKKWILEPVPEEKHKEEQ
jgi:KDO2-lipid IV(A) lauroyltransferase